MFIKRAKGHKQKSENKSIFYFFRQHVVFTTLAFSIALKNITTIL